MVKTESYIAEQNPIAGDQHVQLLQTADQEKCLTTIPNGLHVVPIPELAQLDCLSTQLIQRTKCYQTVRLGHTQVKCPSRIRSKRVRVECPFFRCP